MEGWPHCYRSMSLLPHPFPDQLTMLATFCRAFSHHERKLPKILTNRVSHPEFSSRNPSMKWDSLDQNYHLNIILGPPTPLYFAFRSPVKLFCRCATDCTIAEMSKKVYKLICFPMIVHRLCTETYTYWHTLLTQMTSENRNRNDVVIFQAFCFLFAPRKKRKGTLN